MLKLFKRNSFTVEKRQFESKYFLDATAQNTFETNGYVVLKDVVQPEEIELAQQKFKELQRMEGYDVNKKFESSGNFASTKTQENVFAFVENFTRNVAKRFANFDNCEIGYGGAFFIKPNTDESVLEPHQDSAVIDESKHYGVFVWMPLQDITPENGALYVLPRSHLWNNYYRSQHIDWAFRKHLKFLWTKMKPVYLKKGDAICFDTSIIHSSSANKSDDYRLVVCGALLPKNYVEVEYLLEGKKVGQYFIDQNYWLDGGQAANLAQYESIKMEYAYPNPISKSQLKTLLEY